MLEVWEKGNHSGWEMMLKSLRSPLNSRRPPRCGTCAENSKKEPENSELNTDSCPLQKSKMEWKFIIGKEKAERKLLKFSDEFRGQYCGPTHVHENEFVRYEIVANVL